MIKFYQPISNIYLPFKKKKKNNSICLLYCLHKSYALGSTNPQKIKKIVNKKQISNSP